MDKQENIGLILSGSYTIESLSAEIGRIPPCMLPLGNTQLVFHQIEFLKKFVDIIYLSLPEDYVLYSVDAMRLESHGVQILRTDPDVSVGYAISKCIDNILIDNYSLFILYGDTLFSSIDEFQPNSVSIHEKWGEYGWAHLDQHKEKIPQEHNDFTLSGFFSFSNIIDLKDFLSISLGDFQKALVLYDNKFQLKLNKSGFWYDFGHVQTYFRSVGLVTTQRSFNSLKLANNSFIKCSSNSQKIRSEAAWFERIPAHLRIYTPAFLGLRVKENEACYGTKNTYLSTLSNLSVFGDLKIHTWEKIFTACEICLEDFKSITPITAPSVTLDDYFNDKTVKRLEEFFDSKVGELLSRCSQVNDCNIPNIMEILDTTSKIINSSKTSAPCIIHGDFCFSNIFYDYRSSNIQLIDPRGELPDGRESIYGLRMYDVAKIAHSALGGYDAVIANYIPSCVDGRLIEVNTNFLESARWKKVTDAFKNSTIFSSHDQDLLYSMIIQLFMSMLPLHSDRMDRQVSIFALAILLFRKQIG